MRSFNLALTGAGLALCAAAHAETAAFNLDPGTKVLAPIVVKQLAVFPVVQATATVDKTQYLTLSEGLAQKLVRVAERGAGGEVNRVTIENRSDRPLLLLGGEVILGGQQDRIIGQDTIVPAKETQTLPVYCVEHGRWNGHRDFTAAGGLAEGKLRVRAKFRGDQGQVWAEVAEKNRALGADQQNPSGTYRRIATGDEGKKAIAPFRGPILAALDKLPESKRLVGVIAALNGRVVSVDVFAKPELFAAYREKILDSVFVSASGVPAAATPVAPPNQAQILGSLRDADAAPAADVMSGKAAGTVQKKGKVMLESTVEDRSSPAKPKAVYKSYQFNE